MTLIEMLVVLAIVGVMAGATVLGMGSAARNASVEAEAMRLASRIQLAADDAMVSDRPVAFIWDKRGYAFATWNGQAWQQGEGESFSLHRMPAGVALDMAAQKMPMPILIDGPPIAARLDGANESWFVTYDGLRAVPTRAPQS